MASLRERFVAAYRAFREPMLVTEPLDSAEFAEFESRRTRYAILWSFFENTAYRALHDWSHSYKIQHGLYRYTRNIYNPAHRLGVFWQTHLMGGLLDDEAGDGETEPSALPIATELNPLRAAIAALWEASNWQVNKDLYTLLGTVFGDVGLEVVDDRQREMVYLRVVNPNHIKAVTLDPFGHVKGYTFEETRVHPENPRRTATYTEECSRSGDNVVYRTYLNGKPYAWPGQEDGQGNRQEEWAEPYGFVPLVVVQHNNVGLEWGWSEMHPGRGKFQEVDDLASKLSDQVRKMVDAPWLFSGVDKPSSTPTATSRDSETYQSTSSAVDRPYPGREELPALYGPPEASATPLVAPLDIGATVSYLQDLLRELEREYPELQMDIWSSGGDASGRALRVARQRAESKVRQRRTSYDTGLVRAQQMAIAIGGYREYDGFGGYGLESYDKGELDHVIGKRAVFAQDPMDDIEIARAFWMAAREAVNAGCALTVYLERQGWSQEEIAKLEKALEEQAWRGVERAPAEWQGGQVLEGEE